MTNSGRRADASGTPTTREVVLALFERIASGDPDQVSQLFAHEVDWRLDWPDPPSGVSEAVPWIRSRRTRGDVAQHFTDLAAHHEPTEVGSSLEEVLIDGDHAVVLGTLRGQVAATGASYAARAAIRLTVRDGLITTYHVYEDSLSVALAAGAVVPS